MKEYELINRDEEVLFNQMLQSARNQVECAFGRLKACWIILLRPTDVPTEKLPRIIFACIVLHNFCKKNKAEIDKSLVDKIMAEERSTRNGSDWIHSYT